MINGILSQLSLKYAFASWAAKAESDNCGMTQQTHSCSFKYIHQKYKYDHEKENEPCTQGQCKEQVSIEGTTTENKKNEAIGRWGRNGSAYLVERDQETDATW